MVKYKKGQIWNKPKNKLMFAFEKATNKNAVYNGKITGGFEYWIWKNEEKEKAKLKSKEKQIKKFGLYKCNKCKSKFVYELGSKTKKGCENCHSTSVALIDQSNVMKKEWFKKTKPKPITKEKKIQKPEVRLSGTDGNAWAVIGKVSQALKRAGLKDQVKAFQDEAMSGDYDNVLRTAAKYADIS